MKVSQRPQPAVKPVGKQIQSIHEERLTQFTDEGQYREQSILPKLYPEAATGEPHLKLSVYSPPTLSRPTFEEATSNDFKPTAVGNVFGPSWSTHWFRVIATVPPSLVQYGHLEFHWNSNSEALLWSEQGEPQQGLTGGGEREEWVFPQQWKDGQEHIFYIEMACNNMLGNPAADDMIQPPQPDKYFQLDKASIVAVDLNARQLYFDFGAIRDAAREFSQDSWEKHKALQVANDIMDAFTQGAGSHDTVKKCRQLAAEYLGHSVDTDRVYATRDNALVTGIGHCHIDTCWLWPWVETKRKVARSWASQCDLMDRYPEYRFCCSQAQQYRWLEELYPSLYARVKEKVRKGTFQPIGGSWVEHDTNMPSGESLVRQFLYGQRYFESRFGQRHKTFWLPDTFGYSAQLPQICRLAGLTRFFTQKLSWNNINRFPHTTFNWVALDGRSQVLCHMAPSETYNAKANFGEIKQCVTQHKSMAQDNTSLLVFGKGDGGGGPTFGHLEQLRRCRGISDQVGRLPRLHMGDSVDDFFARLECRAQEGTEFATWFGELYFELHRGTYTTQANNKRDNRRAEVLLHDVEYLATLASIQQPSGYRYPKGDIDDMWENVLLCQFHDCLPGSSIEMCYDDSDKCYEKVFQIGAKLLKAAGETFGLNFQPRDAANLVGINTLGWDRVDLVQLPSEGVASTYGIYRNGPGPARIQTPFAASIQGATVLETSQGVWVLSNSQYRVTVSEGIITSLYDLRAGRQVIPEGCSANQLLLFDDKPLYWQAWDVETYHLPSYRELQGGVSIVTEHGPLRVSITTTTRISERSSIKTVISLAAVIDPDHETHIECSADVDWHETMKFLKVQFPVDICNTNASYETQFGIVQRPTHYNTSWDMAKFEVCCHKWADLSEATYGVSILNDSKYGFSTCGNLMRLSLLRSPKAPNANADMGRHAIRWAVFPHRGPLGWQTVKKGFEFNVPVRLASHSNPAELRPAMGTLRLRGGPGLVLDTVKRAEDDDDVSRGDFPVRKGKSVVCRVYDALGGKETGFLEAGHARVRKAWKCNILEDDLEELVVEDGRVEIELQSFEVASYRLLLE